MGRGQLRIELRTGESALAVPDARIGVIVNGEEIYTQILVASDAGLTRSFELPAPMPRYRSTDMKHCSRFHFAT